MSLWANSQRSLKSFLFPMLLLSIGGHIALLFFVPMPGGQIEEEVMVQPEPEEVETIQVARIPKPSDPKESSKPDAEPKQTSPAEPNPQTQPQPNPVAEPPQPTESAPVDPEPRETEPVDTAPGETDPENTPPPPDDIEPSAYELAKDISNYNGQFDSNAVNIEVGRDNFNAWKERVSNTYGVTVPERPIHTDFFLFSFSVNQCPDPPPNNLVLVGIVVDDTGSLVEDPEVTSSSGYSTLDALIKERVKDYQGFSGATEGEVKADFFQIQPNCTVLQE